MLTKKKRTKKQLIIDLVLMIILVALLYLVFINRNYLFLGPDYSFKTVSSAYYGAEGIQYVIDEGKMTIEIIDNDSGLIKRLEGGNYNRFYYAQAVAEARKDGKTFLYISDIAYRESEDETVEETRVIEYHDGRFREIYNAGGNVIYDIKVWNDKIYVLKAEDYGITLIEIDGDQERAVRRLYCGDVLNSATMDMSTECIAIATKRGAVRVMQKDSDDWTTLRHDGEHLMPQGISAENGFVYFSDLYQGKVCRFKEDDPLSLETVYEEDGLKINDLTVSSDGQEVLCCDLISYYEVQIDASGQITADYIQQVDNKGFWLTIFLWIVLGLSVVIIIWQLRYLPGSIASLLHNEAALRMTAVVFAVVTVSSFIAWSLISEQHQKEDLWDVSDMKLVTDLVVNNLDVNLLNQIQSEADYASSSYMKLRDMLDLLMAETLKEGKDYYYVFYHVEDEKLSYILNYYDTVMCMEPFGKMDATYYLDVYETRRSFALKSQDADGQWLYVLSPVENEVGDCVAVLEIGTDLGYRQEERRLQTFNTMLSVFCSSAVMMMLIVELLFLLNFHEKKRDLIKNQIRDVTRMIPLRTIIVFSYGAATLQDSFVTVLASQLYRGNLPIPDSVAAGLPLSGNLLMMASFAMIGGHMAEKLGSKKTLFTGVFVEISGFLLCAIVGSYEGLLFGNILMGIGLGVINVTCNALAAMGEDTDAVAQAFADVMAGILSGLTIGAGLASLLYPIGGSRLAYAVAASFMVPVIILVRRSMDVHPDEQEEDQGQGERISLRKFFFNWRVLGFLALMLVPFMASISYREYFFPMFAAENGFSEGRIGQVYMICGLLVLYVGPYISSYVIKRFGTFWSIIIASVAMGLNMLIFVLFPSLITAILGMVILSTITSFAYTCQYTYFEELPDSHQYGSGKSMGVYSLFENLGQTIGPMVYGALLTMGYRRGVGLFSLSMLIFTVLYVIGILADKRKSRGNQTMGEE